MSYERYRLAADEIDVILTKRFGDPDGDSDQAFVDAMMSLEYAMARRIIRSGANKSQQAGSIQLIIAHIINHLDHPEELRNG